MPELTTARQEFGAATHHPRPAAPATGTWAPFVLALGILSLAFGLLVLALLRGPEGQRLALLAGLAFAAGMLGSTVHMLRMRRSMRAYELAMSGAHDGMWEWNPVTKELRVGPRLLSLLGYAEDFLFSTHVWLELVHPEDRSTYNRAVSQHLKGLTDHFYCEYRVRARNGQYRWIAARGLAVRNRQGVSRLMAGSVTDISDLKNNEQRIRDLALLDQLTGLPNRRSLAERLPAILDEAQRLGHAVGVLFLDLDRFKDINDALGHGAGDVLLTETAKRVARTLRSYDITFRQGGDEFIIVLPGMNNPDQAGQTARRLLEAIGTPVRQDGGGELFVTASIGIAVFPEDGRDASTLLRNADTAMYTVKAAGGNDAHYYEAHMNERLRLRMSLEGRLRRAVENGDFSLHFQPQIDFRSGRVVGAEALLRWQEDGRPIPPDHFIPVAEESGLIEPLGEWVLDAAVRQAADWHRRFAAPPRVAINLSPRQFWRRSLYHGIVERVARAGLTPQDLELEVTESVMLNTEGPAVEDLHRLREAGFRLALDDFGIGYSSLSYLRLLQPDCLKIDKSFIAALGDPARGREGAQGGETIIRAIIAMAHGLGLEVVAEGVETEEQLALLRELGCDIAQGYLIGRPLPAEDFASRFLNIGGPARVLQTCAGNLPHVG
jgi:diguanylate cyclase (GGDEF)-like protein/PAS domain S-box-containing protein